MSALNPNGQGTLWDVNQNGFQSFLSIDRVNDSSGKVDGRMTDSNGTLTLEDAKWDEVGRLLTFSRTLPNGEHQTFTGFLFDNPGVPNTMFAMAGTFVGKPHEDPRRPGFGWYAFGRISIP